MRGISETFRFANNKGSPKADVGQNPSDPSLAPPPLSIISYGVHIFASSTLDEEEEEKVSPQEGSMRDREILATQDHNYGMF